MDEPRAARHEEHEPVNNDDVDWCVFAEEIVLAGIVGSNFFCA